MSALPAVALGQNHLTVVDVTAISQTPPVRAVTSCASTDAQRIDRLLALHAAPNPRILDASYGHGRLWRGLPCYGRVRMDIRP